MSKPTVLVSNDDGIDAPGLHALTSALGEAQLCTMHVVAPATEQSAKSQALTLGRSMIAVKHHDHQGACSAYALHGTPADSVMTALNSPLLNDQEVDLVLSGINRGDNLGLHVLYSGTVGAAREAACKGKAAMAFSFDNYKATTKQDYTACAAACMPLIRVVLRRLQSDTAFREAMSGNVLNVNLPFGQPQGYCLARMSSSCVMARFEEAGPEKRRNALRDLQLNPDDNSIRVLDGARPAFQKDCEEGTDTLAVSQRWVSVTPLGLMQDYALSQQHLTRGRAFVAAASEVVQAAAQDAGLLHMGTDLPRL